MTRTVAIGALAGFVLTLVGLSVAARSCGGAPAGAGSAPGEIRFDPRLTKGLRVGAPAIDEKLRYSPQPRSGEAGDGGPP
ncbi:MAG: hypothetical protein INH41_31270 [Myxococcaceae bacterium]|nr:hypothetical protein [Myxococcaceae bacterium]